jgi:hypothetical protein
MVKKKNEAKTFRVIGLVVSAIGIVVLGIFILIAIQREDSYQSLLRYGSTLTAFESKRTTLVSNDKITRVFVETAIAQFTQRPDLVLSSTPYFVEVIAQEVVFRATDQVGNRSFPVIGMWGQTQQSKALQVLLREKGYDLFLTIESTGVEGINETDYDGFQAYYSAIKMYVTLPNLEDGSIVVAMRDILATIKDEKDALGEVFLPNMYLNITFATQSEQITVRTSFNRAIQALEENISDTNLIQFLDEFAKVISSN